ncbi:hypothetical protein NDU88_002762 [Pleurodeles waltl]|uniref:Uncharacterized protein n=1 Tax=Pleurodeles waltl TaxID=8319 RepID=A0AAV7MRH2_PLEWA|nr:hypothetical protein NDU88_002762 [Pleurodeles waltl]
MGRLEGFTLCAREEEVETQDARPHDTQHESATARCCALERWIQALGASGGQPPVPWHFVAESAHSRRL